MRDWLLLVVFLLVLLCGICNSIVYRRAFALLMRWTWICMVRWLTVM